MSMEHKAGLIRVMDDKCVSADLAIALNGNTKIIATTIQKFPYIVDSVANLKNKRFAVIIDEAHSSTAGKDMAAITMTLGSGEDTEADVEDMISSEIKRMVSRLMYQCLLLQRHRSLPPYSFLDTRIQRARRKHFMYIP